MAILLGCAMCRSKYTTAKYLSSWGFPDRGKSTLVRCFSRLHEITGGEIIVEGQNIMELSEKELIDLRRRKMGMVFQSFGLLPHRTVLENVAFPLEMRGQDKHTRRERALEVVKLVGLEGREEYFPRELSGGTATARRDRQIFGHRAGHLVFG